MFTLNTAEAQLDSVDITFLGKPCKVTAVSVGVLAQLRASKPAPVAPNDNYNSNQYQAWLMADNREMRVLELAASIDLCVPVEFTIIKGNVSQERRIPACTYSSIASLEPSEHGPAYEAWCKAAGNALGSLSSKKLEPLTKAYDALDGVDVEAVARGNLSAGPETTAPAQ